MAAIPIRETQPPLSKSSVTYQQIHARWFKPWPFYLPVEGYLTPWVRVTWTHHPKKVTAWITWFKPFHGSYVYYVLAVFLFRTSWDVESVRVEVANEGLLALWESPTKHVIFLVVTVARKGSALRYILGCYPVIPLGSASPSNKIDHLRFYVPRINGLAV